MSYVGDTERPLRRCEVISPPDLATDFQGVRVGLEPIGKLCFTVSNGYHCSTKYVPHSRMFAWHL